MEIRRSLPWFVLSAIVLVIDQVTKLAAFHWLTIADTPVLPFLSLTFACNTGAAFGFLQGFSSGLAILGILFAVGFSYAIITLTEDRKIEGVAFSLILAGAVGNVIDRLWRGCVVDFIHVYYGEWSFPIFNVADSAITIGVGFWILALIKYRGEPAPDPD